VTLLVFYKLLAIFATVALGWVAGRQGWLQGGGPKGVDKAAGDPARLLGNVAFMIFVPALLFRTMVRLDVSALPWPTITAYFVPALIYLLAVYGWQRWRAQVADSEPAVPATRTITAVYGNALQLGIPMAAALFGEPGLAIHIALVSLHGLLLLTMLTVLVELDLARADQAATLARTALTTARNTIIHPVVLPVLAGLLWNATGLGLHPAADEALAVLGQAVVPVCLVLIGLTLAQYGLRGQARTALMLSALKLLVLPALVLAVAHWGFGLNGTPLGVVVMMAALPVGSNALIFAQRYGALQAEATAAIVFSTLGFAATASFWLVVLAALG
jgi:malonate transporter and related proteins